MRFFACILLSFCLFLSACDSQPTIAVVDVNLIITDSPHAKKAEEISLQIQEIYQYNLTVIEGKLAAYKNKAQASIWLQEAARQLQLQLTSSRGAVGQAMADTLQKEVVVAGKQYDVVLPKGGVLLSKDTLDITTDLKQRYNNATIVWPPLPVRIDEPTLPPDTEPTPDPAGNISNNVE